MSKRTVLTIDENHGDVLLLREALEERTRNTTVQSIDHAGEALRYLSIKATARDAPPPDLILVSWRIPGADGDALMEFIRKSEYLLGIPHILFIAENQCEAVRSTLKLEPWQCREKPRDWTGYLKLADDLAAVISLNPVVRP